MDNTMVASKLAAQETNHQTTLGAVVAEAAANIQSLETVTRPLLEALAGISGLDTTYLLVFDWDRHEQCARFAFSSRPTCISEGLTLGLPESLTAARLVLLEAALPGSLVACGLGLGTFASAPVIIADRQVFGMLCGASRATGGVEKGVDSVMALFAQIIADHVIRAEMAAITERAALAEERLRGRALFLAEAEHHLKTPLTVLRGAALSMRDDWADLEEARRRTLMDMVVRSVDALSEMVDQLLVESKADVTVSELVPVQLEFEPFLLMVAQAFDVVSALHDVVAEVGRGITAWVDPAPLYQVLGHLLDNAIKFSPEGGVIRVRATRASEGILIEVADGGVGLPSRIDVFEAFRRGESASGTKGIGLGLHIVRNLVLAMGGAIEAHRNEAGGSTFSILLPAIEAFPLVERRKQETQPSRW